MKGRAKLAAGARAVALLLAFCMPGWAQVVPGSFDLGKGGVDFVEVRPPARVGLVIPSEGSKGGELLLEMAGRTGPRAILSGGYLETFIPARPLGLLKVNGRELNRAHRSWLTTGMVCSNGRDTQVLPFEAARVAAFRDCVQAGPTFVRDGRSRYSGGAQISASEQRLANARQSYGFACQTGDGALILGFARGTDLRELADAAVSRLRCRTAVRLTGAETGGYWSRETGLLGQSESLLPNALAAFDN